MHCVSAHRFRLGNLGLGACKEEGEDPGWRKDPGRERKILEMGEIHVGKCWRMPRVLGW